MRPPAGRGTLEWNEQQHHPVAFWPEEERVARRARKRCPIQSDTVVVGIDVAKGKHLAVACCGDGTELKRKPFKCDAAGFAELLEYSEWAVRRSGSRGYVVALEPSGHYSQPLVSWLQRQEVEVYLVQPLHTNRLKELYDGTGRKTDEKDAAVIADICRQGRAKPYRLLQGPYAELRVLCRQREGLMKRQSQTLNRLHRHLDVVFPELPRHFSKLKSATCLWVLRHVPTPAQLMAMGLDELAVGLRKASRGQLGRQRAEALLSAATESVGVNEGLGGHCLSITQLVDQLEEELAQLAVVERAMAEQLEQVPYATRLLSVPGLGAVTVATLLGELGDLRDYRVAQQLISMAGLDLVENSSGQRKGVRRISRRGRAYARYFLYLAAIRLGGTVLAEPRRRMVEERNKPATKAAVANMCRLLRILHALVRDDADFDCARYETSEPEVRKAA